MVKPIVFISKCITFAPVRYNGQMISSEFVESLKPFIKPITHCPEQEIGLGVPRKPIRIISMDKKGRDIRLIQPETGRDFTDKMTRYTEKTLGSIKEADGFILKSKSPSSGFRDTKVYPYNEDLNKKVAPLPFERGGMFGGRAEEFFPNAAVEDESRLNDSRIREHFLKKLFTNARFREIKRSKSIKNIQEFHKQHKLLFMSYNQQHVKDLGKIAANTGKKDFEIIYGEYGRKMSALFFKLFTYKNVINTMLHAFGYFKKELTADEKKFFLDTVEKYRKGRIPASVPLNLLKSYIVRFQVLYLMEQVFFEPFPEELYKI